MCVCVCVCLPEQDGLHSKRLSLLPSRAGHYHFAPGTTPVLTQEVRPLTLELLEETVQAMEVE